MCPTSGAHYIDAGIITVRRSLDYNAKPPRFKESKAARGRREIAMPSVLADILRQHQAEQT
ncbi:MAG TPA: hypothetical protein GX715_08510 [Armatimonadetes bacterium]|jgi:hypothetical protein|nr:hypothetical protein [Armatimonadota bacterium]